MRGGDRCSMSLPVFLLIPQDNSVSAPTPSLLSHASICPLVSTLAQILVTFTLLLLLPAFLFVFLLSHFVALFLPPLSQSLFYLSGSSSFLFLLSSCISPSRLLCLLFVSFSSSGGWRHASPLWLPAACRGNNSCHSVVEKLTEKNEKKGENPAK